MADKEGLLESGGNDDLEESRALYEKLLLQASELQGLNPDQAPSCNTVVPDPGLCIKTRNDKEKVFINICKTDHMPAPRDITKEELMALLDSESPDYRVPMGLGEPHAELDKSGKGCTAYDVVINTTFFDKIKEDPAFQGFFFSIVFEGLESKYDMLLDRNYVILKNRKFLGSLSEQNLRTSSKPRIQEMEPMAEEPEMESKPSLITEIDEEESGRGDKGPEPEYLILREPPEGHPEFLVAEIKLPNVNSSKTLTLDLGEDRILLHAHPSLYHLDIYLPYNLNQEDSGAQFNKDNKVLTLTLPVLST